MRPTSWLPRACLCLRPRLHPPEEAHTWKLWQTSLWALPGGTRRRLPRPNFDTKWRPKQARLCQKTLAWLRKATRAVPINVSNAAKMQEVASTAPMDASWFITDEGRRKYKLRRASAARRPRTRRRLWAEQPLETPFFTARSTSIFDTTFGALPSTSWRISALSTWLPMAR